MIGSLDFPRLLNLCKFPPYRKKKTKVQLTSSIGAMKTRFESTQPKDASTRIQRRDKPCKPSSPPGLRLEDIQAMRGS